MALSGCFSTQTGSPAAEQFDSLGISISGVRQNNIRIAYRYGLAIEQAADSISALAKDHTIRVNAQIWKMYSIPVIRQIFSESEPVAASVDALAFAMQCEEYFSTGIGSNRFGEHQLIAIKANTDIQAAFTEGMRRNLTSSDFDSLLSYLDRWVSQNPLEDHLFSRRSIVRDLDSILAERDHSIGSAIGRIADNVDDLSARLALLSAQLPREARWQGEYLLAEYRMRERLEALDSSLARASASLGALDEHTTSGGIPVDITNLRSLHADILSMLELVRTERTIVLAEVDRQRRETLVEVERMKNSTIQASALALNDVLSHLLWKAGVMIAGVFFGVALLILLGRFLWRGRPASP